MPLQDLIRTFGREPVRRALADDDLEIRFTACHVYAHLTEKARAHHHQPSVPVV
jgi:hypothetical protein